MFQNKEREEIMLGVLMHSPERAIEVSEDLFSTSLHKKIYSGISTLYQKEGIIDLQGLIRHVGNGSAGSNAGSNTGGIAVSIARMHGLMGAFEFTRDVLLECAAKRRIRLAARQALKDLESGKGADEILGGLDSSLVRISQDEGYVKAEAAIPKLIDDIETAIKGEGIDNDVKSGFKALDRIIDGFRPEEYIVIGARPGAGKTSLILNLAVSALRAERRVGIFSAEMGIRQILLRMISSMARLDQRKVRGGYLTTRELANVAVAAQEIYERPLFINDRPNIKMTTLLSEAKRMRRHDKVDIIFVDYMGLISTPDTKIPRYEQVAGLSKSFKQLARELQIPIVVLAQLNREAQDKRPSMANLRESGGVEQDSDMIILLWTQDEELIDGKIKTTLIVEKNRNGATGAVDMIFDRKTTTFFEEAR